MCYNIVTRLREKTTKTNSNKNKKIGSDLPQEMEKKIMKANIKNRTIEMTKNEAKAAGRLGTDKFNELRDYQTAYPTFRIKIVATHQNSGQYKGLTYDYMKKFINKCNRDDKDELLDKFNELTGAINKNKEVDEAEKAEVASYLEVKKWFLKAFPEIKEFKENQKKKLEAILCE